MKFLNLDSQKSHLTERIFGEGGFTLVELLMTCGILVFVIGATSLMLESGYNTYAKVDNQIVAQSEARRNLSRMARYIRECKQITQADPYELTINSDIDDDSVPESVRFYLTDSNTKLNQTVDGANATELGKYVNNVSSGTAVFTYYDVNDSEISDMGYARTASRSIKIKLVIDANPLESPAAYELESIVSLRNFQ